MLLDSVSRCTSSWPSEGVEVWSINADGEDMKYLEIHSFQWDRVKGGLNTGRQGGIWVQNEERSCCVQVKW